MLQRGSNGSSLTRVDEEGKKSLSRVVPHVCFRRTNRPEVHSGVPSASLFSIFYPLASRSVPLAPFSLRLPRHGSFPSVLLPPSVSLRTVRRRAWMSPFVPGRRRAPNTQNSVSLNPFSWPPAYLFARLVSHEKYWRTAFHVGKRVLSKHNGSHRHGTFHRIARRISPRSARVLDSRPRDS